LAYNPFVHVNAVGSAQHDKSAQTELAGPFAQNCFVFQEITQRSPCIETALPWSVAFTLGLQRWRIYCVEAERVRIDVNCVPIVHSRRTGKHVPACINPEAWHTAGPSSCDLGDEPKKDQQRCNSKPPPPPEHLCHGSLASTIPCGFLV
jgi:hypothetical protein